MITTKSRLNPLSLTLIYAQMIEQLISGEIHIGGPENVFNLLCNFLDALIEPFITTRVMLKNNNNKKEIRGILSVSKFKIWRSFSCWLDLSRPVAFLVGWYTWNQKQIFPHPTSHVCRWILFDGSCQSLQTLILDHLCYHHFCMCNTLQCLYNVSSVVAPPQPFLQRRDNILSMNLFLFIPRILIQDIFIFKPVLYVT